MRAPLLRSALRPITRVLIGAIAIPIFRFILRHVFRLQEMDDELEKDLEQWFRGSLLLLAATANMEHLLFGWANKFDWFTIGLRLLLAIGVVEAMPDQELFAVVHPGPPRLKFGKTIFAQVWRRKLDIARGLVCQHLNRSSPVLAIMAAIFGAQVSASYFAAEEVKLVAQLEKRLVESDGVSQAQAETQARNQARAQSEVNEEEAWKQFTVGWVCYLLAITQYLIIGLVTSRDRAMDVLSEFDRAVAQRRRELVEEFDLEDQDPQNQPDEESEADNDEPTAKSDPVTDKQDSDTEPAAPTETEEDSTTVEDSDDD